MGKKYITEIIVEGKDEDKKVALDNLSEPYLFLGDSELARLEAAVNIVAVTKGYKVVSHSVDHMNKFTYAVLMEKQQQQK